MAISPNELDNIYDGGMGAGDEGPGPKANKAVPIADLDKGASPMTFGATTNTNISDNIDYMPEGVYSNQDLELVKGYRQSVPAKIGLRLANAVPNMLGSVAEMIGYTGALATEWGNDRDYSNAFTQAGEAIMNPFGQTFRRSHDTFALSDPTWWIDNVANLAEIAVPFAGEAKFVSAGMEAVAKGATSLLKLGETGARVAQGAAQLGTAGFTAYTEAAMDGASVYDTVYQNQYKKQLIKGLSPDEADAEAKHLASQSAATTVQMSTAMTTLLNLSSIAPFFKKSEDVTADVLRNQFARKTEESLSDWGKRIASLDANDFKQVFGEHGKAKFLKEMGQEGVEEVEQQFAQKTGEDEGTDGKVHGLLEQLGQFEKFFDRTMNKEGALAFVLGAGGGGLQTAIIEHAPTQRSSIDEAGNSLPQAVKSDGTLHFDDAGDPVMKTVRVSPKTYNEWSTRKTFNNARDLVAEDINNFAKMQAVYLAAAKKNDTVAMDKARNDMFNVNQMNAVTSGMADQWINTFNEISKYDNTQSLNPDDDNGPTEAMQRGYASSRTDSEYKAKATEAAEDLRKYQDEYQKLQQRYGTTYESNEGIKDLVDMMFRRKVDLMTDEKLIKRHEEEFNKLQQEEKDLIYNADPESFNEAIRGYHNQIQSAQAVHGQLKADHDTLTDAINKKQYSKLGPLIRKYRAVGANDTDLQGAVNDLAAKIGRHMELQSNKAQKAEEDMMQSSGYSEWLIQHPDGKFEDYRKEVQKKYELNATLPIYRANIDKFKAEHTIAAANYADIHNEKSIANFVKKATDWRENIRKQAEAFRTKKETEISKMVKDKATADRLTRIRMNETAEHYKKLHADAVQELNDRKAELKTVQDEMSGLSYIKDPLRKFALKSQAKKLESQIQTLEAQIKVYASAISDYSVDTSTPEVDVPTDGIVDEDHDLEEDKEIPGPDEVDLSTALDVTGTTTDDTAVADEEISDPLLDQIIGSMDQEVDRYKEFQDLIAPLPKEVKNKLAEVEDGWRAGTLAKSLNYLNPLVQAKKIGPTRAAQLLETLWEIVQDDIVPTDTTFEPTTIEEIEQARQSALSSLIEAKKNARIELKRLVKIVEDDPAVRAANLASPNIFVKNATMEAKEEEVGLNKIRQQIVDLDKEALRINAEFDAKIAILKTEVPTVDLAPTNEPIDPIIDNSDEEFATSLPSMDLTHQGAMIEDAISAANSTLLYQEEFIPKKNSYIKYATTELDPKSNPDIITPGRLMPGTAIKLVVDTDYDGTINVDDKLVQEDTGERGQRNDKFDSYLNEDGKIHDYAYAIGNVPIKMVDDKGKTVGYVRRLDWVTAKYPGTNNYRNVVDLIDDGSGGTIDNIAIQKEAILALRWQIVEQWNANKQPIEAKILDKGVGRPILNRIKPTTFETPHKVEAGYARNAKNPEKSLLPGTTTIAIVKAGQAYTGKDFPFDGQKAYEEIEFGDGMVGTLLPGANGKHFFAPLQGQKLNERGTNIQTASRAIELYLLNDGTNTEVEKEIEKIRQNTGFDIGTEAGLRNFFSQYLTYPDSFTEAQTQANAPSTGERKEKFLFNITDKFQNSTKGLISLGWAFSGKPIVKAKIINGTLDPKFIEALEEGFGTRSKAVQYTDDKRGIKGINSTGKFKEYVYTKSGWKATEHPSYNEYVKSWSKTTIYGRNQANGRYVYTANPQIPFEVLQKPSPKKVLVKQNTSPTEVKISEPVPVDDAKADSFLDLFDFSPDFSSTEVDELGSGSDGTKPLTIANLDNILGTTPELNRNGKTVQEVLEDLTRRGHSFIPQGYNPFSLCK